MSAMTNNQVRSPTNPSERSAHAGEIALHYDKLVSQYRRNGKRIRVSFREIVSWIPYKQRATHFLYPYPAKMLSHIAHYFVNNDRIVRQGGTVLDPFCGSGTTLLEGKIAGVNAVGYDVNPFAVFLSNAKVANVRVGVLLEMLVAVQNRVGRVWGGEVPDIDNISDWYGAKQLSWLIRLRYAIAECPDGVEKHVLLLAFLLTARKHSLADPRMPVPVRIRLEKLPAHSSAKKWLRDHLRVAREGDLLQFFVNAATIAAAKFTELHSMIDAEHAAKAQAVCCDVRKSQGACDAVITSPPYCAAQKYVRSTKHAMAWLELAGARAASDIEKRTIGRERVSVHHKRTLSAFSLEMWPHIADVYEENRSRALVADAYITDMAAAIDRISQHATSTAPLVFVVGDSVIAGKTLSISRLLKQIASRHGYRVELELVDEIRSRALMTNRPRGAEVIETEQILVLRRQGGECGN